MLLLSQAFIVTAETTKQYDLSFLTKLKDEAV